MRIRYRKLESRFDAKAYVGVVKDAAAMAAQKYEETPEFLRSGHGDNSTGAAAAAAVTGLVSAPRQVTAEEQEASLEEVRELVRCGALAPTDLVNSGSGWDTIEHSPLFLDEVGPAKQVSSTLIVGAVVAAVLALVLVLALLA